MDLSERIKRCIARHPEWDHHRIAGATGGRYADIEAVKKGEPLPPPPSNIMPDVAAPVTPAATFSLKGVHLLSRKPQDVMKARLYGLQRGVGYKIEDLARAWGVSLDTLKTHAKNYKALAYVEATPGEYVPCVVHPDTPKGDSL